MVLSFLCAIFFLGVVTAILKCVVDRWRNRHWERVAGNGEMEVGRQRAWGMDGTFESTELRELDRVHLVDSTTGGRLVDTE